MMNNTTESIYLVPLELAHLVPSPKYSIKVMLLLLFAGIAPIGVITNMLACVTLIKSRLMRNSTYSMIFSLSMANLLYCVMSSLFQTTGIIMNR